MIKVARRKVPEAEFRVGSLFEADIPACYAATAVSEVLNYPFDTENGGRGLIRLFCPRIRSAGSRRRLCLRCHRAGAGLARAATRGFSEGKDRVVLVEKEEDWSGDVDPPDRQLPEGGGTLQAGRRSAPSAVIQAVGDHRRIASSGLSSLEEARLRLLPSAEGSRGVRCAQTGLKVRWDRRFAEEV